MFLCYSWPSNWIKKYRELKILIVSVLFVLKEAIFCAFMFPFVGKERSGLEGSGWRHFMAEVLREIALRRPVSWVTNHQGFKSQIAEWKQVFTISFYYSTPIMVPFVLLTVVPSENITAYFPNCFEWYQKANCWHQVAWAPISFLSLDLWFWLSCLISLYLTVPVCKTRIVGRPWCLRLSCRINEMNLNLECNLVHGKLPVNIGNVYGLFFKKKTFILVFD